MALAGLVEGAGTLLGVEPAVGVDMEALVGVVLVRVEATVGVRAAVVRATEIAVVVMVSMEELARMPLLVTTAYPLEQLRLLQLLQHC